MTAKKLTARQLIAKRRKSLRNKCDKLLREYCYARDKNTCQKCRKQYLTAHDCQMSHVYGRARDGRLKYDPHNVKVLCFRCHLYWWHENILEASAWFNEAFPERAQYLKREHKANMQLGTITTEWYEDRAAMLAALISEL